MYLCIYVFVYLWVARAWVANAEAVRDLTMRPMDGVS